MKKSTAKIVSIGGLALLGVVSGQIIFIPVIAVATASILLIKDKTPHQKLVDQCQRSLKMNYADAECYARNIEAICTRKYIKAYKENTITREE